MIEAIKPQQLAKRLDVLEESATLALAKRVRALRAEGKDVLSMTLGEPDFDTPVHIGDAAIAAIHEGFTHYPPVAGIPELREAVAVAFQKENGIACSSDNIVVSTGAKQSIVNILMSLVDPGDEVIILAPYWVSYLPMVKMAEGTPVILQGKPENGLNVTAAQLEAAITPSTRIIMFNSPSNPAGTMYTPHEVESIAKVIAKHPQVYVIADEIYARIAFDVRHKSLASIAEIANRVITISGVSKAFAMTGWRIGFTCAPLHIAKAAEKYQGQVTSGACSISQRAALAAMTGGTQSTDAMVAEFKARRDIFCEAFRHNVPKAKFQVPAGAFYLYPDFSAYLNTTSPKGKRIVNIDDLADYLVDEALVSGVPGSAFGTDVHIRFSYACSREQIIEASRRMGVALAKLT